MRGTKHTYRVIDNTLQNKCFHIGITINESVGLAKVDTHYLIYIYRGLRDVMH